MRTCWILGSLWKEHTEHAEDLKKIGPVWSGPEAWRSFQSDNVISNDNKKSMSLLKRAFQSVCNFYIHKDAYATLGRPSGVKMYDGNFSQPMDHTNEIITCHLVAPSHDIVLLLGFDLSLIESDDLEVAHKNLAYLRAMKSVIYQTPNTQWVLVNNGSRTIFKELQDLPNFTCDEMKNVLQLLL